MQSRSQPQAGHGTCVAAQQPPAARPTLAVASSAGAMVVASISCMRSVRVRSLTALLGGGCRRRVGVGLGGEAGEGRWGSRSDQPNHQAHIVNRHAKAPFRAS